MSLPYTPPGAWGDALEPPASDGVTRLVMRNCGVWFTPAPDVMEGARHNPMTNATDARCNQAGRHSVLALGGRMSLPSGVKSVAQRTGARRSAAQCHRGRECMALIELSIDTLGYELINKRFRNPVLGHARKQLHAALGTDLDAEVRSLFAKEWDGIERGAELARATGQQRAPIDALDHLGVNHFTTLFEKYFSILVPAESIPEGDAARATRRTLTAWLQDVKDVRNPNAHPGEADLSVFDALKVADACLRVARLLQLDAATRGIEEVRQELLVRAVTAIRDEPQPSTMLATLPPREDVYDQFVGRTTELEALWSWYADEASHRWVLVGDGGKGKSAIAYQFAASVRQANPASTAAVLWMSAKTRRFEDSEVLAIRRPDFADLSSALDRLLSDYGDSQNLAKTVDAKREVVLQLLDDFPSLLVIDDIDSIEESNEDVVEFFTYQAPRTRSKILLTSRRMYPGMAKCSTRITGLPKPDARTYVSVTAQRLGLENANGLDQAFGRLYDVTEGSPLYLEDLLRLCRSLKVSEAIDRWQQQKGDAARRYALERECDLLSNVARRCLEAACWAKTPLSIAQLEAILGIGADEAISAVQELESRFLVPTPEIVEGVPAFRAHRNLEVLVRQDLRADPTKGNLRQAVESALRVSVQDSHVIDVARQVNVRINGARLVEALQIAEDAVRDSNSSPDLLALRAEVLAKQRPPRMTDARQDWSRAMQLGLTRRDAFLRWADAEGRVQDWRRMHNAAEAGLTRNPAGDPWLAQQAGYAASRCGQSLARGSLDHETAQEWLERAEVRLREALRMFKTSQAAEYQLGRVYRALIVNAQYMRDRRRDEQVVYWTLQWLSDSPSSPEALEEAARQAQRHPEVADALASLTPRR